MIEFIIGVVIGFSPFLYLIHRAIGSEGWDDTNILNVFRVLSHLAAHPEDFAKMWYIDIDVYEFLSDESSFVEQSDYYRPFEYIGKDEFSEVFPRSRPWKK